MRAFLKCLISFTSTTIYMLIGGAIFQAIEQKDPVPPVNYPEFQASLAATYNLSNTTIEKLFAEFRKAEEQQAASQLPDWDMFNSALYCLTIFTTIGYGVMVPTTPLSRSVTMLYALIGIPIFGILIGTFGDVINKCHGYTLSRLHTRRFVRYKHTMNLIFSIFIMSIFLAITGAIYTLSTSWSFGEGFYYSFISMTTIGFGDYVYYLSVNLPDQQALRVFLMTVNMIGLYCGLALVGSVLSGVPDVLKEFRDVHIVGTGDDGKKDKNENEAEMYENDMSLATVPS